MKTLLVEELELNCVYLDILRNKPVMVIEPVEGDKKILVINTSHPRPETICEVRDGQLTAYEHKQDALDTLLEKLLPVLDTLIAKADGDIEDNVDTKP